MTSSEIGNGSLKEHGNYSYLQGIASISENGSISINTHYGNVAEDNSHENYSGSWNANGFTPGSQSFSVVNNTSGSGSYSANVGTRSDFFTDYTTGLDIKNESGSGGNSSNSSLTGTLNNLTYNESDGYSGSDNGSLFSGTTVVSYSDNGGYGQILHFQEQFSGTTFTVSGNATFGEIYEEKVNGQVVSQPPTPPDFSGKVTVALNNLIFDNSSCYGSWPLNGTITVNSDKNVYTYDFSINSTGNNCWCANVSVNGGSGSMNCNINSAQPVYLSLTSMQGTPSQSATKSLFGHLFVKK